VRTLALIESSVQPGNRTPAPEPLALVQAFVNTVDREHGPDLLDTRKDIDAWSEHRGRRAIDDLGEARRVREALRSLLWANNGGPREPSATATLEHVAQRLEVRFEPFGLEARDVVAEVVGRAFLAMADGSWERLKACPGHNCGWAFYDRSVNASATWCSMRICGNRAKARAYYRRRR
jgi:predicted RNA-binding Zn ribbon-like protein